MCPSEGLAGTRLLSSSRDNPRNASPPRCDPRKTLLQLRSDQRPQTHPPAEATAVVHQGQAQVAFWGVGIYFIVFGEKHKWQCLRL